SAAIYLPSGKPPALDDLIYQADWARTFKGVVSSEQKARENGREAGISAGIDHFYKGPIARALTDFARSTDVLDASGSKHLHLLTEAAKLAFADRENYYGDPDFTTVPLDRLLSKEYAAERRRLIDVERASGELRPGDAPVLAVADAGMRPSTYRGDTTHVDA